MDLWDHPEDHPLHNKENKKKFGYLKDEMNGKRITMFIALKSKMYCLLTEDSIAMRAKVVSRTLLNHEISFNNYFESLFENKYLQHYMKRIWSKEDIGGDKKMRLGKMTIAEAARVLMSEEHEAFIKYSFIKCFIKCFI